MWRSNEIKKYLLGLLSFIVAFLFIEGLARIGYTLISNDNPDEWFIYSSELGWERKPDFRGPVYGSRRVFDSNGFIAADTEQITDTKKNKIIFIGDSNTFGNGVPTDSTFVEVLDDMLPNISAINLAVPGYTSYQGYKTLLKYVPELSPDIAVVSFNFNDRRYVVDEDYVDSESKFQREKTAKSRQEILDKLYSNLYIYRLMSSLFEKSNETNLDKLKATTLKARVGPEDYRDNLIKIAEFAKNQKLSVIFMILKDNPIETEYLKRGIKFLENSQHELAIEALKMGVRKNNGFSSLSRLYLAKAYREIGLSGEAEDALTLKTIHRSFHGGQPIYLDTEYNKIMREVAQQYNIEIVDAGRVLDENYYDYFDICHFDQNGHQRVAYLLAEQLSKMLSKDKPI